MKNWLTLLFLLLASTASAATQDHARIREAVTGFVQQQTAAQPGKVSIQVSEIDPRINLPACASFDVFLPPGSSLLGKTAIGVRCAGNASWSLHVPVHVRVNLELLVSARQLPAGHVLQEGDLTRHLTEITRSGGYSEMKEVVGKVLRYGITAGQVLREDMLRAPYSVMQGQTVQISVRGAGFSIRSEGSALNNAAEGQPVQVKVGSGRLITGTARADGVVEVNP